MADTRRKTVAQKSPVDAHVARLVRWAELVALTKQLNRAIDAAGEDNVIKGHHWIDLGANMDDLLGNLVTSVPEE